MNTAVPFRGEVYLHWNTARDKGYVGQTTQGMAQRWKLHVRCSNSPKTPAYDGLTARAIRKYGADAFEHQVLSGARSQSKLDNLEKVWIILLQTKAPNGYNLTDGGYGAAGHVVTPEVRARLSAKQKANWKDPAYRIAHIGYNAPRFGRHDSPETIEKRAVKMRGRKQPSSQIAHRVEKLIGKKRSQEFRNACAARMAGRKRSEETRLRMSLAQKQRQARKEV